MDKAIDAAVLELLSGARDLTIATMRDDGYPQATTVSFVNDGLKIYFACDPESQKARNIARNAKVSLTVNAPYAKWEEIKGLSLGGRAELVTGDQELAAVQRLMLSKFPQIANFGADVGPGFAVFRVTPDVISVLDYTKGFGHTELVVL